MLQHEKQQLVINYKKALNNVIASEPELELVFMCMEHWADIGHHLNTSPCLYARVIEAYQRSLKHDVAL